MKAVFENAGIADAITKASIVAPVRGKSFDKSAGILIDIGADGTTTVSSTDTLVYFRQWLRALECDEPMQLLLPSTLLRNAVGALPIGSDKTVTFEVKPHGHGKRLLVSSGRLKAFMNMMIADNYPRWGAFNPDSLSVVASIGAVLKAVEWATAPAGEEPFSGVHLANGCATATDKYKAAVMECDLGDLDPVTIPAGEISKLLKQSGEIRFGVMQGLMMFMPDEATQIMATTIDSKYPDTSKAFAKNQTHYFSVFKTEFLELLSQMNQFQSGSTRTPKLSIRINGSTLMVLSSSGDAGAIANSIEIEAPDAHDEVQFEFAPDKLLPCISNAPGDKLTIYYFAEVANGAWRICADNTYQAWAKPLVGRVDA